MIRTQRLLSAAFAVLCFFGIAFGASAQSTTITASHLKMSGYPISTGLVTITPVNANETPVPFADGTGAQNGPTAFACQIVSGAITGALTETGTVSGSCVVPDAAQTTPANILYLITVSDLSSGLRTSGMQYTLQGVVGVSGSSWALDHYGPPATTTNVTPLQATQGTTLPSPCIAPSLFTLLSGGGAYMGSYTCVAGTEVALASGGTGATGPAGPTGAAGAAATVTVGTTTTLAAGAAATVTNSGTSSAAVLNFGIPQGVAGTGGGSGGSMTYPSGNGVPVVVGGASWGSTLPTNTTVNGQSCALGGTCSITALPPTDIKFYPAAVCDGGSSFASGVTRYDNQQPTTGCDAPATSTVAYLAFANGTASGGTATVPQYAQATVATPTYWSTSTFYIKFEMPAGITTGNVGWIIDTACTNDGGVVSNPTFGTPITVTTNVSATTGASVTTAAFTGAATVGSNGCTAGTTLPGSLLTYRIHRSLTDTAAGQAQLLGVVIVTGRSQ